MSANDNHFSNFLKLCFLCLFGLWKEFFESSTFWIAKCQFIMDGYLKQKALWFLKMITDDSLIMAPSAYCPLNTVAIVVVCIVVVFAGITIG